MPQANLISAYDEMDYLNPLIILIQQGEDPVINFLKVMKEMRISSESYYILSLGQG